MKGIGSAPGRAATCWPLGVPGSKPADAGCWSTPTPDGTFCVHSLPPCSLGSEANLLRSQQRDIAAGQAARQAAKDAYKLSLERTAGFRALCSGGCRFFYGSEVLSLVRTAGLRALCSGWPA